MKPIWIGLDIGGTQLKGGALDARGRALAQSVEVTRPNQSPRTFERQLDAVVKRLTTEAGGSLRGIGASITGPVDPKVGCVYLPGKIRGLDHHRTVPYLQKRWGVPVTADNDGRLACYAEWKAGAGRGVDNLLVLTMGTGIGSGVVSDGRLLTDRHFLRGTQCGHLVIDVHGPRCLTGPRGTGESVASVTALVQQVRSHQARGLVMDLRLVAGNEISFPDIVAAVKRRDPVVSEIFDTWLDRFATVILNSFYAYSPELILLAGGPTKAAPVFLKKLADRVNAWAFRVPVNDRIPIKLAKLGSHAGWIGAALRIKEQLSEIA